MPDTEQKQPLTPELVKQRIRLLGVTQERIARELNRSEGAISRALKGERKQLLGRIDRWLDRYERRQGRAA